jgi:hypothetical protein
MRFQRHPVNRRAQIQFMETIMQRIKNTVKWKNINNYFTKNKLI